MEKTGSVPKEVGITTQDIKLDQFIKWAQISSTGGEAKALIQEGMVKVNGVIEQRRGRRLIDGDIVELVESQEVYRVVRRES